MRRGPGPWAEVAKFNGAEGAGPGNTWCAAPKRCCRPLSSPPACRLFGAKEMMPGPSRHQRDDAAPVLSTYISSLWWRRPRASGRCLHEAPRQHAQAVAHTSKLRAHARLLSV